LTCSNAFRRHRVAADGLVSWSACWMLPFVTDRA